MHNYIFAATALESFFWLVLPLKKPMGFFENYLISLAQLHFCCNCSRIILLACFATEKANGNYCLKFNLISLAQLHFCCNWSRTWLVLPLKNPMEFFSCLNIYLISLQVKQRRENVGAYVMDILRHMLSSLRLCRSGIINVIILICFTMSDLLRKFHQRHEQVKNFVVSWLNCGWIKFSNFSTRFLIFFACLWLAHGLENT